MIILESGVFWEPPCILSCMFADGDDVSQCCASNGLTGDCLAICTGNITTFPQNVLDCQSHLSTYTSCYSYLLPTTVAPTTPGT